MDEHTKIKSTTEREIKRLLSLDEFEKCRSRVLKFAQFQEKIKQINHYYDTTQYDLYRLGTTLRIRQKNGMYLLECKSGKKMIDGVRVCNEISFQINGIPSSMELKYCFPDFDDQKYYFNIGCLITERVNYQYDQMLISMDKNSYLGFTDYEIEIELLEKDKNFTPIIQKLELNDYIAPGKYTRFINRYINLIQ